MTTENIPEDLKCVQIERSEYAKWSAKGKLSDSIVTKEWEKIWQSDLPRAYKTDIELYPAGSVTPDYSEIDIFVGLK